MARIEKKSISCRPVEENSTIQRFERFGWTLESSQEVYNKDSHIEKRFDANYSVTETTNYVKLVFSRDKDMPYYDEISALEAKYELLKVETPSKGLKVASSVVAAIYGWPLAFIGALLTFFLKQNFLWMFVLGVVVIVLRFLAHSRYKKAELQAYSEYMDKQEEILEEAKKYV